MDWAQVIVTLLVIFLGLFLLVIIMLVAMLVRLSIQIRSLVRTAEVAVDVVSRSVISGSNITSLAGSLKSLFKRGTRRKDKKK